MVSKLICLFLLVSCLSSIAEAGVVDDVAANSVKKGTESFTFFIGDSMIDLSGNGSSVDRAKTPGLIVAMLSFNLDPFTMPFVREWWGTSLIFFVIIAIMYICAGGGFALLSTLSPSIVQEMAWLASGTYNNNFEIKEWVSNIGLALIFPFVTYFGVYLILELSVVITALLSTTVIDIVPLTSQNIVVYLFMAFTYLILSIIMGIRSIVIVLFCAGGLMLAALYLIPALRGLIKNIFMYFLLLVFMQPLLVFVAAVGVMFITSIPPMFHSSLLLGLMILLLLLSIVLVFGYGTVSRMIEIAGKAATV